MDRPENGVAIWLGEKGTYLYIFMMMAAFPLFCTNKMFNLVPDKEFFFLFITLAYVCIISPAIIKSVCSWRVNIPNFKKSGTVFAIILSLSVIISTIVAIDSRSSFFRMEQRTVSGLCFVCCIIVYFTVREYGRFDGVILWGWLIGSSVIYLFGILCACGINFMHIQSGIVAGEKAVFLTPLGNMDINASYVCLMLPAITVMYMICKEQFSRMIHGLNLYMGFLFTFFIKTESSVIAIGVGIVILLYFAIENKNWFEKYIQIIGIYLGSKATICILIYMFGDKLYPFDGIGRLLLESRWIICEIICYLAFVMIWKWKRDNLRTKLFAIRKYALAIGIIVVLCCGVCVIYVNMKSSDIPESTFWNYLILNDSTFSGRGFIWIRTVRMLGREGIIHKIFGNGLNSFTRFMADEGVLPISGITFYDPHNEILQMASDMGLLGLLGYFGLIISTFLKALQDWKKNELQLVVILVLGVYMIQGLVNPYSIFCLPLLFIFLGLANGSISNIQKENQQDMVNSI